VQFLFGGRASLDEAGRAISVATVHPVQDQAVQVDVQVGSRAKALDQRDGAALAFVALEPRVAQQMPLDHTLHHLPRRRDQLGLRAQQHAQRDRQPKLTNSHPLPHRHVRDDMVHQVRCRLRHPPGPSRGAEAAPLAAERQQLVVPALAAAQAQEAVGQDAALEEGVELILDEARQRGPGAGLGVGDETGRVLLHQAVQRGLLGAVALVVERARWGGPRRACTRARGPPAGNRHGGGAAQSGNAQRRPGRQGRPACLPPQGSLRWRTVIGHHGGLAPHLRWRSLSPAPDPSSPSSPSPATYQPPP
jgi:hypothetical protein